jgi:hypothetical protein
MVLREEVPGGMAQQKGGRGGGVFVTPTPPLIWDLFWGQRGKPSISLCKQEKLESTLNPERVFWA